MLAATAVVWRAIAWGLIFLSLAHFCQKPISFDGANPRTALTGGSFGAMETIRRVYRFLVNLEWTEQVQHNCKFCDRATFTNILYEDNDIIAFESYRPAGRHHWLILPKDHVVRDVEHLNGDHLVLLQAMDRVKHHLINEKFSAAPRATIFSGYHRGRRPLIGTIYYPDIISIHHLHLHVIVQPHPIVWLSSWLPLIWKSDAKVMEEVRRLV